MHIAMIGTGYVGLVSGVCFSEFGFDVTCVDMDDSKISRLNQGELPIFEPGLDEMMDRNRSRLNFTTNLEDAVGAADIVFIAVGTPSRRGDGEADLTYVHNAARQVAKAMKPGTIVVIKSTVVVGTAREVGQIIAETAPGKDFSIVSNPEFLREGSAIEDFMRPDRIVVGAEDQRSRVALSGVYRPLFLRETPVLFTSLENAELIKYAANAFLAMKITFINEIADLCEKTGGDVQDVAKAIGLDNRIGSKFLHPGPGYGGSCFPKDSRALAAIARRLGSPVELIETTVRVNEARLNGVSDRIIAAAGGSVANLTIGILGIAFKPNTDDIREAPSIFAIPALQSAGARIKAHDPEAMIGGKDELADVNWCNDAYETAENCDVLVILTEWNEYRALDLQRISSAMNSSLIIDFRNIYRLADMEELGFKYVSVGRPVIESKGDDKIAAAGNTLRIV